MSAPRPQRSASRLASFRHAFAGWWTLIRTQPNARIHLAAAAAVTAMGLWLGLSLPEWALIALAVGLVLVAEFFNTALESVVDLASPHHHLLAKSAKDLAAGGVLMAAFTAVVVGLLVLGPPLVTRIISLFAPR